MEIELIQSLIDNLGTIAALIWALIDTRTQRDYYKAIVNAYLPKPPVRAYTEGDDDPNNG